MMKQLKYCCKDVKRTEMVKKVSALELLTRELGGLGVSRKIRGADRQKNCSAQVYYLGGGQGLGWVGWADDAVGIVSTRR